MFWHFKEWLPWTDADSTFGQATVEAALLLPVFLLCVVLSVQPLILYFDKQIMDQAAAEGCRVAHGLQDPEDVRSYVFRRLQAVPSVGAFHYGTWEIEVIGGEESEVVAIQIGHMVRLLPGAAQLGSVIGFAPNGTYFQSVLAISENYEDWVVENDSGANPPGWVSRWEEPV